MERINSAEKLQSNLLEALSDDRVTHSVLVPSPNINGDLPSSLSHGLINSTKNGAPFSTSSPLPFDEVSDSEISVSSIVSSEVLCESSLAQ